MNHDTQEYALTVFDIQMLYIPSINHLEAIEYNEISKEDTERRYSLLKRTDLQADFSKVVIKLPTNEEPDGLELISSTPNATET